MTSLHCLPGQTFVLPWGQHVALHCDSHEFWSAENFCYSEKKKKTHLWRSVMAVFGMLRTGKWWKDPDAATHWEDMLVILNQICPADIYTQRGSEVLPCCLPLQFQSSVRAGNEACKSFCLLQNQKGHSCLWRWAGLTGTFSGKDSGKLLFCYYKQRKKKLTQKVEEIFKQIWWSCRQGHDDTGRTARLLLVRHKVLRT